MTTDLPETSGFTGTVAGRVQGVGFRYFVARSARGLGLSGYVRNLPDGTVEVAAAGSRAALERWQRCSRRGLPGPSSNRSSWTGQPGLTKQAGSTLGFREALVTREQQRQDQSSSPAPTSTPLP